MVRTETFIAVFGALCASAAMAALSELLTWQVHLNNLAAELLWVLTCAIIGFLLVMKSRRSGRELLRVAGIVLVATAAWQVVKGAIVLLEGTTQIAGLSYQLALIVRIGAELSILALVIFFGTRLHRSTTPG